MTKTAFALAAFLALSLARSSAQPPPPPDAKSLTFEVVTIKPTARPGDGWRLQPTPDGYTGTNVSLFKLIQEAYGFYFDADRISGGPAWIDRDKFDLEAKFDPADIPNAHNLTYRQRGDMLRAVLADRFQLKIHVEKKNSPVYNLVISSGGSKLKPTPPEEVDGHGVGITCHGDHDGEHGCTVGQLADDLRFLSGRIVIDKTGLTGLFDYHLRATAANASVETADPTKPIVFTAVQEQLGLKLEPATAPLDILVIDAAERPTPN